MRLLVKLKSGKRRDCLCNFLRGLDIVNDCKVGTYGRAGPVSYVHGDIAERFSICFLVMGVGFLRHCDNASLTSIVLGERFYPVRQSLIDRARLKSPLVSRS